MKRISFIGNLKLNFMKQLVPILILVIACNTKQPSPVINPVISDSTNRDPITMAPIRKTNFDSCKFLHERIVYYIEQSDMKLLKKKTANKKIDSLQAILYRLREELNLYERKYLSDYANHLVNELVDRKVARDNR